MENSRNKQVIHLTLYVILSGIMKWSYILLHPGQHLSHLAAGCSYALSLFGYLVLWCSIAVLCSGTRQVVVPPSVSEPCLSYVVPSNGRCVFLGWVWYSSHYLCECACEWMWVHTCVCVLGWRQTWPEGMILGRWFSRQSTCEDSSLIPSSYAGKSQVGWWS